MTARRSKAFTGQNPKLEKDPNEVKEEWIDRGTCDVDHIVIVGYSGNITPDVIQWMMEMRIVVSLLDYSGYMATDFLPPLSVGPIVKQRQAAINMSLWLAPVLSTDIPCRAHQNFIDLFHRM